jgi:hypothetical protein
LRRGEVNGDVVLLEDRVCLEAVEAQGLGKLIVCEHFLALESDEHCFLGYGIEIGSLGAKALLNIRR